MIFCKGAGWPSYRRTLTEEARGSLQKGLGIFCKEGEDGGYPYRREVTDFLKIRQLGYDKGSR